MDLGHLASIGLPRALSPLATLSCTTALELASDVTHSSSDSSDRFFVLKSRTRESIEISQAQSVWALRSHGACGEGNQPHQRFTAARNQGRSRVFFLFAENAEHAWVGYAFMQGDPWHEVGAEFPHVMQVEWQVCLPPVQGVSFSSVLPAGDSHKVFNGDEIRAAAGHDICAAIDAKMQAVRCQAEIAHGALLNSSFLRIVPGESEPDAHRRLLQEVEGRLGRLICACRCGSRRYNLHFPESDHDLLVIYAAEDPETAPPVIKNPAGLHPDYTLLEVGRFTQMLVDGDPRMVESLFLEAGHIAGKQAEEQIDESANSSILWPSPPWASIVHLRDACLTQALVRKYLGDATGRAGLAAIRKKAKLQKHRKILYIAFRTLANALQVCRGEALQVRRSSGSPEHSFIMALRREENGSVEELLLKAEALAGDVRTALEVASLPEEANPQSVVAWLAEVRTWAALRGLH